MSISTKHGSDRLYSGTNKWNSLIKLTEPAVVEVLKGIRVRESDQLLREEIQETQEKKVANRCPQKAIHKKANR